MDFMKILRSFEELLYEIMSWLVFYPRTLYRILRRPATMADYTLGEMCKPQDRQFAAAISPPLMLILSLLLAHVAELVLGQDVQYPHNRIGQAIFGTDQGLLLFRSVCFGLYALIAAIQTMSRTKRPLDRDSLRGPFYVHSYLAAPFALITSLAFLAGRTGNEVMASASVVVVIATFAWYICARTTVFRHLTGTSLGRSIAIASMNVALTTVLILGATFLLLQFGR